MDRRAGHPAQLPALDRPGLDAYKLTDARARVASGFAALLKQPPESGLWRTHDLDAPSGRGEAVDPLPQQIFALYAVITRKSVLLLL